MIGREKANITSAQAETTAASRVGPSSVRNAATCEGGAASLMMSFIAARAASGEQPFPAAIDRNVSLSEDIFEKEGFRTNKTGL